MILNIFVLFLISGGVQENSILNYVVRVGFNKEVAFEKKKIKEIKEPPRQLYVGEVFQVEETVSGKNLKQECSWNGVSDRAEKKRSER